MIVFGFFLMLPMFISCYFLIKYQGYPFTWIQIGVFSVAWLMGVVGKFFMELGIEYVDHPHTFEKDSK